MIDPALLSSWGIELLRERPDIMIAGSPERTEERMVIEDQQGRLFILEAVLEKAVIKKKRIATIMEYLHRKELHGVAPYCRHLSGEYLKERHGLYWQAVPYIPGIQLDRPAYVMETWRGGAAADFLLSLRESAPVLNELPFSLPRYIDGLVAAIASHRVDVLPKVEEMHRFVRERLYSVYDNLPTAFSHGDYHVINVIWGERKIEAVIDWEFCGLKPELYDAANMVSCLGIEDPECLWSGAPVSFLERLRSSGKFAQVSFTHFPVLMIALRFAWLSEWLRKKDDEMIKMEFDYFDILSAQASAGEK